MSEKVISLLERKPHITGKCICLNCKHEWTGVAPLGTHSMECSNCGLQKGVWQGLTVPETFRTCEDCGCAHYFISPANIICALCGKFIEVDW